MTAPNRPQQNPLIHAARKALDTWAPNRAFAVAAAIREAHLAGLRQAAKLLHDRGELILAMEVQKLQQEIGAGPVASGEGIQ